mgnify:CR=1 FL=1
MAVMFREWKRMKEKCRPLDKVFQAIEERVPQVLNILLQKNF